jgi:hypothetical protein
MKMRTMMLMLCRTAPALGDDKDYKLGPDSMRQDGVPQGTVTQGICRPAISDRRFAVR